MSSPCLWSSGPSRHFVPKGRGFQAARPSWIVALKGIESSAIDIQTEGGSRRESQTVMQVSSYVNEVVLQGSTVAGVWYDIPGTGFAETPRCAYALVCVDEASLPAGFRHQPHGPDAGDPR